MRLQSRLARKLGVSEFLKRLKAMDHEGMGSEEEELIKYVVSKVCEAYKVHPHDVMYTKKRGVVTTARNLCFAVITRQMPTLDQRSIGLYFNGSSRQTVYRASKRMQNFCPKNFADRKYLRHYEEISQKATRFVERHINQKEVQ